MIWAVEYTENAEQDLQDIYNYISDILLSPEIAEKQTDRIMDACDSLNHMPLRHRVYENEPWSSKGLRFMPVNNYLIFYLINESKHIVEIIRIMYASRDIDRHLEVL